MMVHYKESGFPYIILSVIILYVPVGSSWRKVHAVHLFFCHQKFASYDKSLNSRVLTIAIGQGRLKFNMTSIQHINSHINQKQLEFLDFRIKSRAKCIISQKKLLFLKYATFFAGKIKKIPKIFLICMKLKLLWDIPKNGERNMSVIHSHDVHDQLFVKEFNWITEMSY